MAEVKWIKITTDMFDDEKIKIIQALPEGDSILVIWVRLIILAGKTNANGYVYINENLPYTEDTLTIIFNKPLSIIRLALQTFEGLKMIESTDNGIYLINFEKYQNIEGLDKIREQTRKRVAKYRENQKLLTENNSNVNVTLCNATDKDIDKDIDKKKKRIEELEESNNDLQEILDFFNNNIGIITPYGLELIKDYLKEFSAEVIIYAMQKSVESNKRNINYIKAILNNWNKAGIKTLIEAQEETNNFKSKEVKQETEDERLNRIYEEMKGKFE